MTDLFFQPKICWKAVGRNLTFAIVESGTFLTAPASFISAGKNNEYILAFLCSAVGRYYFYKNSDTTGAGDIMLNIQSLVKFPIPQGEERYMAELVSLLKQAQSEEMQREIDRIIFGAYGLSASEIAEIRRV